MDLCEVDLRAANASGLEDRSPQDDPCAPDTLALHLDAGRSGMSPVASGRRDTVVHGFLAVAAAMLWLVSLPRVDLSAMSGWGLLPALPGTWYLALAGVVPYLVAAVRGRCSGWVLALYQATLIAVLFATTSAVYRVPRFAWTYKHIGVTEHLLATGRIDRAIDIYNNWPGMFVLSAAITRATGISTLALAQWAEPFFAAATSAAMLFAVRAITRDRRVAWVSLIIFTLGNWVAQNYYSPQAAAFVLSLLMLGLMLRWMPLRDPAGRPVLRAWLARWLPAPVRARALPELAGSSEAAVWPVLTTVLFAAVVVIHQLTPVALLLQVGLIAVVFRVRLPWIVGVWVAMEAGWVTLAWPLLARHFSVFDPGVSTPSSGEAPVAHALPGMDVVSHAPVAIVAAVGLISGAGLLTRFRRGVLDLVPVCLIVGPPAFLALQTYGGEGVFRAYLFALAWLSVLAAWFVVDCWRGALRILVVAATVGVSVVAVLAMLGSELFDEVPVSDVTASRWFETRTPDGSYAVTLTGSGEFPLLVTANYPAHITPSTVITDSPGFLRGRASPTTILTIAEDALAQEGPGGYFAITQRQLTLAVITGEMTPTQARDLVAAVLTSRQLQVVYHDGNDVIAHRIDQSR